MTPNPGFDTVKGTPKFLKGYHFKQTYFSLIFLYIYNILHNKSFKSVEEGKQQK